MTYPLTGFKCKKEVYTGCYSPPTRRCSRIAKTEAGYCRQHDPDLKKVLDRKRLLLREEKYQRRCKIGQARIDALVFIKQIADDEIEYPFHAATEFLKVRGLS